MKRAEEGWKHEIKNKYKKMNIQRKQGGGKLSSFFSKMIVFSAIKCCSSSSTHPEPLRENDPDKRGLWMGLLLPLLR